MRRLIGWDDIGLNIRVFLRGNKLVNLIYEVWSYPHIQYLLSREFKSGGMVLDLGCGRRNTFAFVNKKGKRFFSVGVDIDETGLSQSKRAGVHNTYIKGDITVVEFVPKSFDIVLALDVIEHLSKEDGLRLIEKMEMIARSKVIIVTPNGWEHLRGDKLNEHHKCGWEYFELRDLGYNVKGLWGLHLLRPMRRYTFLWPLWGIVSGLTQKFAYFFPRVAGAIFAVKEMG